MKPTDIHHGVRYVNKNGSGARTVLGIAERPASEFPVLPENSNGVLMAVRFRVDHARVRAQVGLEKWTTSGKSESLAPGQRLKPFQSRPCQG